MSATSRPDRAGPAPGNLHLNTAMGRAARWKHRRAAATLFAQIIEETCGMRIGGQTEFSAMRQVALRHPLEAFWSQDKVDRQWRSLHYLDRPDIELAIREHEQLAALLEGLGATVVSLPGNDAISLDAVYARDSSVVCNGGLILCNMGKPARRPEPALIGSWARSKGLPVLGAIEGDGILEGGDVAWLNERTVAVGLGYRTNAKGIEQFRRLLGSHVDELITVHMPHHEGPERILHLMSVISPIDRDLAVVYSPLLPVSFRQRLIELGLELIEVPGGEYERMGCNVLAVRPRCCIMVRGNPETKARLVEAGCQVHEYDGQHISVYGEGGPTCLTRPLWRE